MNNDPLSVCTYSSVVPLAAVSEAEHTEQCKQLVEHLAASWSPGVPLQMPTSVANFRALPLPDVLKVLRAFFHNSYPHLLPSRHRSAAEVDKICGRVLLCLKGMRQSYLEGLHGGPPGRTYPTFGLIMVHKKDLGKVAKGPKTKCGTVPKLLAHITDTDHTSVILPSAANTFPGMDLLLWQRGNAFLTKFEINDPDEPINNPSCWFLCPLDEERFSGEHRTTPVLDAWLFGQVMGDISGAGESCRVVVTAGHSEKQRLSRYNPASSKLIVGTFDELEYENMRAAEGRCCECGGLVPERRLKCCRCHRAQYCGKECQVKDWKRHKGVCAKTS